jgi:hypothetical protein
MSFCYEPSKIPNEEVKGGSVTYHLIQLFGLMIV